ncbi:MAG: hypothetical protein HY737_06975 [Candidatus Omnitrophica bacterium]|nr:hypothetical protein [Candidatus Omnitrophota bacterium]
MSWDEIQGQAFAKTYLQGHLATGRVANAYLLIGSDETSTRQLAIEMGKALNCTERTGRPCDQCRTCAQMTKGVHPDLHVLLPEGPADRIKIETIRQVLSRVALRPYSAACQVVIIDGAERLTEEAANALLKALEEPSASTKFFLTTSALPQCLPTIVSRCQLVRCPSPTSGPTSERWRTQLADPSPLPWLTQPLPDARESVAQLLEEMMAAFHQQAARAAEANRAASAQRYVDAALKLIDLQESLEQFVSPRLVAALAREQWLTLQRDQVAMWPNTHPATLR